jgi:hypothetical protein
MSLGTTTRSLPKTKIAPALFAVPAETGKNRIAKINHESWKK